jgi:hypothetical protein
MKTAKRLTAWLAALAFAVLLAPAMPAAAADTNAVINSYNSYAIGKITNGTEEVAVTPSPSQSPVPSPTTTTKPTTTFAPTTSVDLYTSDLTMRIYFSGTAPTYDYTDTSVEIKPCNFDGQNVKACFYAGCYYVDIVGLKYNNNNDNDFRAVLNNYNNGSEVFFQIGECTRAMATATPNPSASATPTATPDPRAPGLIIKSSSISENSVNAGDDFKLNLTVYATSSGNENVLDVLVSIAPGEGLMVASGSSTQYIGTMKPGSSQTVSFPMQAQADFTKGVSTVAVTLSGTGATAGTAANATGTTISVPICQPDRFQISKVEVPESIMVGEEQMATITFVNMGKNPVSNLTLDFACDNCQESKQNQYVGNLAAGTEDSVDFDLIPVQAGELSGTITVSYEASNGQTVTQTQNISATVEESMPGDFDPTEGGEDMPVDAPAPQGLPTWAIILIVAGGAAVIVVIFVLVRRHKAKKQKALEAEDEDI